MSYFVPETLTFLRELALNNRTEWFRENSERYETLLREPYRQLLADLAEPLKQVAPMFEVDHRKVGGSLFRIQRNTRFSHDKSPYNTWLGARFLRSGTRADQSGELFMHIAADGYSEVGAGMCFPSSASLSNIRAAIADPESDWPRVESQLIGQGYRFVGKNLLRAPRGYDVDHPQIHSLRRQACAVISNLTDEQVCSSDLINRIASHFEKLAPFLDWQHAALGFTPAKPYFFMP